MVPLIFHYELTESSPDGLVFAFPGTPSNSRVGRVVGWILMAVVAGGIAFGVWSIMHGTMAWHAHPALMMIGMVLLFFSTGETPGYDTKHMIRYGRLTVSQMIGIEQFVQGEVERWSGRAVG